MTSRERKYHNLKKRKSFVGYLEGYPFLLPPSSMRFVQKFTFKMGKPVFIPGGEYWSKNRKKPIN